MKRKGVDRIDKKNLEKSVFRILTDLFRNADIEELKIGKIQKEDYDNIFIDCRGKHINKVGHTFLITCLREYTHTYNIW